LANFLKRAKKCQVDFGVDFTVEWLRKMVYELIVIKWFYGAQ